MMGSYATSRRLMAAVALAAVAVCAPLRTVRADGGQVRLSQQAGPYRVTVFSEPAPLRVGPVDISALVVDGRTGEVVEGVETFVQVAPLDRSGYAINHPATREAATNKLLRSAKFTLSRPGEYEFIVAVIDGLGRRAEVGFSAHAAPPLPPALAYWPYFVLPLLGMLWFCMTRWLVRRTDRARRGLDQRTSTTGSGRRPLATGGPSAPHLRRNVDVPSP